VTNDGNQTRYANTVTVTTRASLVVTTAATNVDSPAGSATLNGYVVFPNGTLVDYYYEYIPNCDVNATVTATPTVTLVATGSPQNGDGATVTSLSPGLYCYRIVGKAQNQTTVLYGQYVSFVVPLAVTDKVS